MKKSRKTPPFEHWQEWTQSRFFSFIRSALRSAFNRYPPKYEALKQARKEVKGKGRQKWSYTCAACDGEFMQKDVQVDHRIPAGTLRSFDDLPAFCERLFCGVDGLDILCKGCHRIKTAEERKK